MATTTLAARLPPLTGAGWCRVYLCRHSRTVWNTQDIVHGRGDVSIDPEYRAAADALGDVFRHTHLDVLASSPLRRARQTAAPVEAAAHLACAVHAGFREMDFGVLEGTHLTEPRTAASLDEMYRRWSAGDRSFALPEAESFEAVAARASEALDSCVASGPDVRAVAVVSHKRCLSILLTHLLGLPAGDVRAMAIENCSVSVVDYHTGLKQAKERVLNYTEHLPVMA